MAWFAPLIAAVAKMGLQQKEPMAPIQPGGGVVQRRMADSGSEITGAIGDMAQNAIMSKDREFEHRNPKSGDKSGLNLQTGPDAIEGGGGNAIARRQENLSNYETMQQGMVALQNNPGLHKDYAATLDDAMKKAQGGNYNARIS